MSQHIAKKRRLNGFRQLATTGVRWAAKSAFKAGAKALFGSNKQVKMKMRGRSGRSRTQTKRRNNKSRTNQKHVTGKE